MSGFQGSSTVNIDLGSDNNHYRCGHLAMTYTGLSVLLTLGDDLSRCNRKALVEGDFFYMKKFLLNLTNIEGKHRYGTCMYKKVLCLENV